MNLRLGTRKSRNWPVDSNESEMLTIEVLNPSMSLYGNKPFAWQRVGLVIVAA